MELTLKGSQIYAELVPFAIVFPIQVVPDLCDPLTMQILVISLIGLDFLRNRNSLKA